MYRIFVKNVDIYVVYKKAKKVNFSSEIDFFTYYVTYGLQVIANILQPIYKLL